MQVIGGRGGSTSLATSVCCDSPVLGMSTHTTCLSLPLPSSPPPTLSSFLSLPLLLCYFPFKCPCTHTNCCALCPFLTFPCSSLFSLPLHLFPFVCVSFPYSAAVSTTSFHSLIFTSFFLHAVVPHMYDVLNLEILHFPCAFI